MVFTITLLHNATNIFVLYYMTVESRLTTDAHQDTYNAVLLTEFKILIGLACFFNFLALLFLGHLTYFHLMLQKKGMTTYEYIRWKANNTRKSKIVKSKADKQKQATNSTIQEDLASPGA